MHLAQSKVLIDLFQKVIGSRDEVLVELRRVRNLRREKRKFLFFCYFFSSSLKEKKSRINELQ